MPPSHSQLSDSLWNDPNRAAQGEQTASPPMKGLRMLFQAITALKEDTSYQELTSVVKEGEHLRMELGSKETAIKQLELSKEEDREKFQLATESLVHEHHKHYTKLDYHREKLENEVTATRESMQKKDDSRKVLEDQQANLRAEVAKLTEDLNSSNAFGRDERQNCLKLVQDFNAAKDEIDRLKADCRYAEGEINKLRESKLSLEKRHNDVRQSLQSSDRELERLRGLAVELGTETLATTRERIENLWREALYMVNKHFRFKLPESSEQNVDLLKRLKDVSNKLEYVSDQSVPLPRRDSVAMRNMRCALVLARLMQLINSELFQPDYIVPVESGIRNYLLREAVDDSKCESFRRAFLLSVFPNEQTRNLEERAARVFNRTVELVEGIIDVDQVAALRSDLQGFVKLASTTWQAIQRLQDRFEPNMDYTINDSLDWLELPLEDSEESENNSDSTASSKSDEAVLVVFPRMYIVKDAEPKPVTPGIVLMKSQTVAAAQEVRSEAPKSPTFGRVSRDWTRNDRRRDSVIKSESLANRGAATFLDQAMPDGQLR